MRAASSSPSGKSPGSKRDMTRAVVANLNRQKSASGEHSPGTISNISGTNTPPSGNNTAASGNNSAVSGNGMNMSGTGVGTRSPKSNSKKTSPYKSLPPQPSQSKDLPDVPEYFTVRPAPSGSNAKVERNDRRVFINRNMMEKINVYQGSVVLIQRHHPQMSGTLETTDDASSHYESDDDDENFEQTTVGIAWPINRIEPTGMTREEAESSG
jgi:hypothetical protein